MVIVTKYKLVEKPLNVYSVRCFEILPCPCCGEELHVIGTRRRKQIKSCGEVKILNIRRLRCTNCRRIHHELPDCLIPYKHHDSECIEEIISKEKKLIDLSIDETTCYRIRRWFRNQGTHLVGALKSIAIRLGEKVTDERSEQSLPVIQRIGTFVGQSHGWLARTVRAVANSNLWLHTRFEFLSASS